MSSATKWLSAKSRLQRLSDSNSRASSRRGTLVVCVLVCLLVATSVSAASVHAALLWRRSMRADQQLRQTELLLDAGILRASKQLRSSPTYQGETWRPDPRCLRFDAPVVQIRVNPTSESNVRLVEVTAQLGTEITTDKIATRSLTQRSHSFSISIADLSNEVSEPNPESRSVESTENVIESN